MASKRTLRYFRRLDYQPLFREISQRSIPKSRLDAWGEPLLISANQKLACTNPSGINYMVWLRRYSLTRPVRGLQCFKIGNIQDCDNGKCSRSWRMGIVSFSTAWVRKLHWFSSWRQGQNTVFKSIAIAIFSSYFANVRASKLKINWKYCWVYCWQNEGADEVDWELKQPKISLMIRRLNSNSDRSFNHKLKLVSSGNFAQTF